MSLAFSAISPHSPLLISSIGKEALQKLQKTQEALQKLEEDFYLSKPDIIIIITPHSSILSDAFTFNVATEFKTDLKEFSDLTTNFTFKGELKLPSLIKEEAKKENFPVTLVTEEKIDISILTPLIYLLRHLPTISILPLGICGADAKTHFDFGYFLKEQIMNTTKRVAVVASGNLSHALTKDAPAGFSPEAKKFDEEIQKLLTTGNTAGLVQLNQKLIAEAHECGLKTFLLLLGILRGINFQYKSYAYEAPFGVGYLTANLIL